MWPNVWPRSAYERVMLAALLLLSAVAHGYNMFQFPYYENDEGTYMSQAWSLITQGALAPYTYWYDHAPGGWILIALWTQVTGGFFTFGMSVNSGRVLMLILHVITAFLLYVIARRLSNSSLAGIITLLIFSLSPLGIYFQRRVLLDNMMVFWILLSLFLLLSRQLTLHRVVLSGLCFGLSILTKENAISFVPAFFYGLYTYSSVHVRRMYIPLWLAVVAIVISWYFLYALLKGELLPPGFFGQQAEHVSLLSTAHYQVRRGSDLPFWQPDSEFFVNVREWISRDALTIGLGGVATLSSILLSFYAPSLRIPAFLAALFWVFLMRGGLIINFYIVPLIPLLALNIGVLSDFFIRKISHGRRYVAYGLSLAIIGVFTISLLSKTTDHWRRDETSPQVKALEWIKQNVDPNTVIVIDDSLYVDLHAARFPGDPVFPHAEWAWKVEKDPEIRQGKLNDDWRRLSYITLSHEILKQIKAGEFPLAEQALAYSSPMQEWRDTSTAFVDIPSLTSSNGDWMSIYGLHNETRRSLGQTWDYYRHHFIDPTGYVVDPQRGTITSEGQSYALLRSVWLDDRQTFNTVWGWTRDHLQTRIQDRLFSWHAKYDTDQFTILDAASASDADQDIALALLFAFHRWHDVNYLIEARRVINDIWERETVWVNGHVYITAGSGARREDGYLLNPSYLSPATYRIFSTIDRTHPWTRLVNDSYGLLHRLAKQRGLPPNWLLINKTSGQMQSAQHYIHDSADYYSYDAFRLFWRVALDVKWFADARGSSLLKAYTPFFAQQWDRRGTFAAVYNDQGIPQVTYGTISTHVGPLSVFSITNPARAQEVYTTLLEARLNEDQTFWADAGNYYDQNWAWFGAALHAGTLDKLWPL